MRRYTLLLLCSASSLGVPAHAQGLRDRSFCDASPVSEGVNGEPAPNLLDRSITSPNVSSTIGHNEIRRVAVNGSEAAGTIVNQWPKPGVPIVNHFLLLCVSTGNLAQQQPPPLPPPPPPRPLQKCPDGTMIPIGANCRPKPPPQQTTQQCPDGSIIASTATCPADVTTESECTDGPLNLVTGQCTTKPSPATATTAASATATAAAARPDTSASAGRAAAPATTLAATTPAAATTTAATTPAAATTTAATTAASTTPVPVPNVSGETEEQAVWALKQASFAVRPDCCVKSRLGEGRVVYTQPGAGELIPKGSEVTYMMSAKAGWPTWLLILGGLATLGAVAALSWLAIPKRPRIGVRLPVKPTAAVAWGDPIAAEVEVAMPSITSTVEFPPYKERDR